MPDEADPPRKQYGFKPASFERLNAPPPEAPETSSPSMRDPSPPAADPNNVFTILRKNQAVANQAGLNEVIARKIKFRRTRDYWLILLSTEAAFGALAWFGRGHPIPFVFGIAGMALFGAGFTWYMWQVADKY